MSVEKKNEKTSEKPNENPNTVEEKEERSDWEETRRCMLKVYTSHIQTHAGLLIAIIIGSFTLISRYADFYRVPNDTISFGVLLSLLVGMAAHVLARFQHWSHSDGVAVWVPYSKIAEHKQKLLAGDKEKEVPYTCVLARFIEADNPKGLFKKIGKLTVAGSVVCSLVLALAFFVFFLWINGFLWR